MSKAADKPIPEHWLLLEMEVPLRSQQGPFQWSHGARGLMGVESRENWRRQIPGGEGGHFFLGV